MAQFDVFRNANSAGADRYPYLLDVQTDLLDTLATRVIIPLARPATVGNQAAARLNPRFTVQGEEYILLTQELASIPGKTLGPHVDSLAAKRDDIIAALDLVFTGI